jgi:hypothetical protein
MLLLLPVLPVLGVATSACAGTIYVGANRAYQRIQDAIDAASASAGAIDTIVVDPGNYPESLEWDYTDLTIQGAGAGQSIIDPDFGPCLSTSSLSSASKIDGFTFQGGKSTAGGGMLNYSSDLTITNCAFTGNTGDYFDGGGGMTNDSSNPRVVNCTFIGNWVYGNGSGGGMENSGSSPTVINCTFVGNYVGSGGTGGAIDNEGGSHPTITNCILWGNTAPVGNEIYNDSTSSATLRYTDSQDITPANTSNGNFNAVPQFVRNPNIVLDSWTGAVDLSQSDFGDLHLQKGSPCIDTGDNTEVTTPPFPTDSTGMFAIDLDGNKRIAFGSLSLTVDLGAYEYFSSDTTPPVITTPADITVFATSTAGAVVTFTVTATDDVDGTDSVTCSPASGSTFAPGKTTVNCTTSDAAGNPASKSFTVWVQYRWSGFLSPLGKQSFSRGSTIPVKFALTGASAGITNLSATLYVTAPGGTQTSGTFKYDPTTRQYQYNWNTSRAMSTGTYTLTADFRDGVTRTIQVMLK